VADTCSVCAGPWDGPLVCGDFCEAICSACLAKKYPAPRRPVRKATSGRSAAIIAIADEISLWPTPFLTAFFLARDAVYAGEQPNLTFLQKRLQPETFSRIKAALLAYRDENWEWPK
jgi:hypothetical protein